MVFLVCTERESVGYILFPARFPLAFHFILFYILKISLESCPQQIYPSFNPIFSVRGSCILQLPPGSIER